MDTAESVPEACAVQAGAIKGTETECSSIVMDTEDSVNETSSPVGSQCSSIVMDSVDSELQASVGVNCSSAVMDVKPLDVSVRTVTCKSPGVQKPKDSTESRVKSEVPEYLKSLYERSSVNLTEEESSQLASLFCEFQDIFSQHDLDLGCFLNDSHDCHPRCKTY